MPAVEQPATILVVTLATLALPVRAVRPADIWAFLPVQAQPSQVGHELIFVAGLGTLYVGIFHAQDEDSAVRALGEQPVEQGGARIPHVQLAGGARRKTDAHRHLVRLSRRIFL